MPHVAMATNTPNEADCRFSGSGLCAILIRQVAAADAHVECQSGSGREEQQEESRHGLRERAVIMVWEHMTKVALFT